MNTIYYFITRKIIRRFFVNVGIVFRSIFYMSLVTILLTIPTVVFRKHIFTPEPEPKGVAAIICLIAFGILFAGRLFMQLDTYDLRDEPSFVENFINDCYRSDNRLEKDYKIAKQEKIRQKKEVAQQKKDVISKKKEAKKLAKERINDRSDILDL